MLNPISRFRRFSLAAAASALFLPLCAFAQSEPEAVGHVSENAPISFTLTLPPRNTAALDTLLRRLYDPQDSLYHHYLTPGEFEAEFSPSLEDYQALADDARAEGLTVVATHRSRMLLDVSGPAGAVEQMLGVGLQEYLSPSGRLYHSPDASPTLPAAFSALSAGVAGLDTATVRRPALVKADMARGPVQGPGSGPNGGLSPLDIKAAYGLDTVPLEGIGQTLGLFELDGFTTSDIREYESYFGLPQIPLQVIPVDNVSEQPGADADETTLDMELINALAPRAQGILVYEGPNTTQGTLDTYARIADDDKAQEISTSWGSPEDQTSTSTLSAENTIFEQMAAQGQSIYSAMGDNGADDDGSNLSVDDPASQPYVTGVGGTTLTTHSVGGTYESETVWNNSSGIGGGGITGDNGNATYSAYWPIPSYQVGAISSASLGSTTMRNCPDVSLNADPDVGYAIYYGGQWVVYGGTSTSAPLWAGFTALVNQERVLLNKSPLGLANPAIYAIGKGTEGSYANDFHDVTQGNNNYYPAVTGYDLATGWGSFNGAHLLADLAGSAAPTADTGPFSYPAGFSLFSLPYNDASYTPSVLFAEPGVLLYVWNGSSYTVSPTYPADAVRPGTGYWADFSGNVTTQYNGTAVTATAPYTGTTLSSGWNQIGDPFFYPIPLANLQFVPTGGTATSFIGAEEADWISGVLYSYDPATNAYLPLSEGSSLTPGMGYWIYATQALTMQVPPP